MQKTNFCYGGRCAAPSILDGKNEQIAGIQCEASSKSIQGVRVAARLEIGEGRRHNRYGASSKPVRSVVEVHRCVVIIGAGRRQNRWETSSKSGDVVKIGGRRQNQSGVSSKSNRGVVKINPGCHQNQSGVSSKSIWGAVEI